MDRIWVKLLRYLSAEQGQTLAEYVVLLTVICIAVVAIAVLLGDSISSLYNKVVNGIP